MASIRSLLVGPWRQSPRHVADGHGGGECAGGEPAASGARVEVLGQPSEEDSVDGEAFPFRAFFRDSDDRVETGRHGIASGYVPSDDDEPRTLLDGVVFLPVDRDQAGSADRSGYRSRRGRLVGAGADVGVEPSVDVFEMFGSVPPQRPQEIVTDGFAIRASLGKRWC